METHNGILSHRVKSVLIFCCSLAWAAVHSQDALIMVNGDSIRCKVTEIGLDEIKYRLSGSADALEVTVEKQSVARIHLSDGRLITVTQDPMNIGYASDFLDRKQALKMDFLSPALQHLTFCYERVIKPRMNMEVKVGWIGLGGERTWLNDGWLLDKGALVKAGMKFLNTPDYIIRGARMAHPLKGGYVKPEIMFSVYNASQTYFEYNGTGTTTGEVRSRYTNLAFNVVIGHQSVFAQGLTFDMFVGLGYGGQWRNGSAVLDDDAYFNQSDWQPYAFTHLYFGRSFPVSLSTGMTIGWAF